MMLTSGAVKSPNYEYDETERVALGKHKPFVELIVY